MIVNDSPTTLLICVNRRFKAAEPSCAARGSLGIADAIERGVQERRIDVRIERIVCLGRCNAGPTLRLAPGGRFFLETKPDSVPEILDTLEQACGVRDETDDGPPVHLLGS